MRYGEVMRHTTLALLVTLGCGTPSTPGHAPEPGTHNPLDRPPEHQVDQFHPFVARGTDVLLLVDNSSSMVEEQFVIRDLAQPFIDGLLASGLDYHVGVVSTDVEDQGHAGKLRQSGGVRWIDPATSNPATVFGAMAQMGTDGAVVARGLDAVVAALDTQGASYNEGFEREDAVLHVVVLSDGTDQSAIDPADFATWLAGRKPNAGHVSFSSIVPLGGGGCGDGVGDPSRYLEVTERVGGLTWDLCGPDAVASAGPLVVGAGAGVGETQTEFLLTRLPNPATLEVSETVDGVTVARTEGEDWVYDPVRNAVVFVLGGPPQDASIEVAYDVLEAGVAAPGAGTDP